MASARAPLMATGGGGWRVATGVENRGLARRVAAVLRVRARRVAACPTGGRGRKENRARDTVERDKKLVLTTSA